MPADKSVKINLENITNVIYPAGHTNLLLKSLQNVSLKKTFIVLGWFAKKLEEESPQLFEESGFKKSYELFCSTNLQETCKTFYNPYSNCWVLTARELLNKKSHLNLSALHIRQHLEAFNKLICKLLIDSNIDFSLPLWTDENSVINLPGWKNFICDNCFPFEKIYIVNNEGNVRFFKDKNLKEIIEVKDYSMKIAGLFDLYTDDNIKSYVGGNFTIEKTDTASLLKWNDSIEKSVSLIKNCNELLFEEIITTIKVIVPVAAENVDVHSSASYKNIPGMIVLSLTSDISILAEAIVHEYHHLKLYLIQNLDPLISGDADTAVYYSPWRKDPRPLNGILHGTYVFFQVLYFWCLFFSKGLKLLNEERIKQRVFMIKKQLDISLKTLIDNAVFTQIGGTYIKKIYTDFGQMKLSDEKLDEKIKVNINKVITDHYNNWETENRKIIDQSAEAEEFKLNKSEQNILTSLKIAVHDDFIELNSLEKTDTKILNFLSYQTINNSINQLRTIIDALAEGNSLVISLLKGHYYYSVDEYLLSLKFYLKTLILNNRNSFIWKYFAFNLRHLEKWEDAELILKNLPLLVEEKNSFAEFDKNNTGYDYFIENAKQIISNSEQKTLSL